MFHSVWQMPKFDGCDTRGGWRGGHGHGGRGSHGVKGEHVGKASHGDKSYAASGQASGGSTGSGGGSNGSDGAQGASAGTNGTSGSHGAQGTQGAASGGSQASCGTSYHNGGVEGDGLKNWYDEHLADHFDDCSDENTDGTSGGTGSKGGSHGGSYGASGGTSGGTNGTGTAGEETPDDPTPEDPGDDATCDGGLVLDLTEEGAIRVINLEENPDDGTFSGSVEYLDDEGVPVALGHFEGVSEIIMPDPDDPDGPDDLPRDIAYSTDGVNGPGLPPKADLTDLISSLCTDEEEEPAVEEPEEDLEDYCEPV